MPQRPDLPCADCGKLMWRSTTSLPAGEARCLPCRRRANPPRQPREPRCRRCGFLFVKQTPRQQLCWNPCLPRTGTGGSSLHPASPKERGYDGAHSRARRDAIAAWEDGDPCARCAAPMYHGEPVDLDHTDDRTGYLGLSHRACNRSSTGRLLQARHDSVCEHCGITYSTKWEAQQYCSNPCRRAARAARHRPIIATQLVMAMCAECGCLTNRPVYCGDACSREAARRREAARPRRVRSRVRKGVGGLPPRAPQTTDRKSVV